jgi:hypothetical protein
MVRNFRKLAEFTPSEGFVLLQLISLSLAAAVFLKLFGLPRLVAVIARCAPMPCFSSFPAFQGRRESARLSQLVELATRVTHGQGSCLPRSLLMLWLFKSRGEEANLLIGVSKAASMFASHAWIEVEGQVMGDAPESTERFVRLLRL